MTTEHTFESHDESQTRRIAAALGRVAGRGLVVALHGEMGSGKTTFVRGLAEGLDSPDDVTSPTYTLMHSYRGRLELVHFDAWLTARESAFLASGGAEEFVRDAVCAVEWAAEVAEFLPPDRLELDLSPTGPQTRRLVARALGPDSAATLERWREEVAATDEPASDPTVGGSW